MVIDKSTEGLNRYHGKEYALIEFESVPFHGFEEEALDAISHLVQNGFPFIKQCWDDSGQFGYFVLTRNPMTQSNADRILRYDVKLEDAN